MVLLPSEFDHEEPEKHVLKVLEFIPLKEHGILFSLNRSWNALKSWKGLWQFRCKCLAIQYHLYLPSGKIGFNISIDWETFFWNLWKVRHLWSPSPESSTNTEAHKIQVFVRIKALTPGDESLEFSTQEVHKQISLPLHQRLSLLKVGHGLEGKHSTRDALLMLARQGEWFSGSYAPQDEAAPQESNTSENQGFKHQIHNVDEDSGEIVMATPTAGLRNFAYNGVLGDTTDQDLVYAKVGATLVCDVLNGVNGTLFVYGQTGSGKTYTMFGPDVSNRPLGGFSEAHFGLVPRICSDILCATKCPSRDHIVSRVFISYVEVKGDQVFDLLRKGRPVGQSQVAAQEYVLRGQSRVRIESENELLELLRKGEGFKSKAATKMNATSTRAHTILIVTVQQTARFLPGSPRVESQLFMADLGGSERIHKSKAVSGQVEEAVQINQGLLALKRVISALNANATHIPYHENKLTMMLSKGLGGNSRTRVVVCVNQHPAHAAETLESLRFGEECSSIRSLYTGNNASLVISLVRQLDKEIEQLEKAVKEKERWETVEVLRQDTNIEKGTLEATQAKKGGEVVRTTRLVGAEHEHQLLEQAHARRRKLLGI